MTATSIKGSYIAEFNELTQTFGSRGIDYKIETQIQALNSAGLNCELIPVSRPASRPLLHKVLEAFPLGIDEVQWPSVVSLKNKDYFYIRKPNYISGDFISFIKHLRITYPHALILMEIPTYPYDGEFTTYKDKLHLAKDRWNRKKIHKYLDYIVDLFNFPNIFNTPTIEIVNGIPVHDEDMKLPSNDLSTIKMVCAAGFSFWHGIDRLLKGLKEYRDKGGRRPITLTLIGQTSYTDYLRNLSSSLGLDDIVFFLGNKRHEEVAKIIDSCNLGVESLARHRTGNTRPNSSLKSRDYLNMGLPFLGEGKVDVLPEEFEYYFAVPNDESPIAIPDIIRFFDAIYMQPEKEVIKHIHNFAKLTVDEQITFRNVINAIKDIADK